MIRVFSEQEKALAQWRDNLLTDKDDIIINAAKWWFGEIKTPFNKHTLLSKLESFILKPENSDAIINMLDKTDKMILAFILYFNVTPFTQVAYSDFASFIEASMRYKGELDNRINNLKLKLLISVKYVSFEKKSISLNPIITEKLKSVLKPIDVIEHIKKIEVEALPDFMTDICSVISTEIHSGQSIRNTKAIPKKPKQMLEKICPGITENYNRISSVLYVLQNAGVISSSSHNIILNPKRFIYFCEDSNNHCETAFIAASLVNSPHLLIDGHLCSEFLSQIIHQIIMNIAPEIEIDAIDFMRFALVCSANFLNTMQVDDSIIFKNFYYDLFEQIAISLINCGFLEKINNDTGLLLKTTGRVKAYQTKYSSSFINEHTIIIEESHEIKIMPEAPDYIKAFISSIARLEYTGLIWTAMLDKAAISNFSAYNLDSQTINTKLKEIAETELPQSLSFAFSEQKKRSDSVKLRSGFIVALDSNISKILENYDQTNNVILEKLSENTFLLNVNSMKEAVQILNSAGIDYQKKETSNETFTNENNLEFITYDASIIKDNYQPNIEFTIGSKHMDSNSELQNQLLDELSSLDIKDDKKDQIEDMIYSGIIISKDQLQKIIKNIFIYNTESRVSALDIGGKLRLIERASKNNLPIEIKLSQTYLYSKSNTSQSKQNIIIGVPIDLSNLKKFGSFTLLCQNKQQRDIDISSISTIRIIQTGIF